MARPRKVEPAEIRRLKEQGLTYKEIAEQVGLTVSGVQQSLQSIGHVQRYTSHKEAIPWRVAKEHSVSKVAQHLRTLSSLSQGKPVRKSERANLWVANTAISWANEILDQGLDVDYDRAKPASDFSPPGGFYLRRATPEDWHLQRLMDRVLAARTRKLE